MEREICHLMADRQIVCESEPAHLPNALTWREVEASGYRRRSRDGVGLEHARPRARPRALYRARCACLQVKGVEIAGSALARHEGAPAPPANDVSLVNEFAETSSHGRSGYAERLAQGMLGGQGRRIVYRPGCHEAQDAMLELPIKRGARRFVERFVRKDSQCVQLVLPFVLLFVCIVPNIQTNRAPSRGLELFDRMLQMSRGKDRETACSGYAEAGCLMGACMMEVQDTLGSDCNLDRFDALVLDQTPWQEALGMIVTARDKGCRSVRVGASMAFWLGDALRGTGCLLGSACPIPIEASEGFSALNVRSALAGVSADEVDFLFDVPPVADRARDARWRQVVWYCYARGALAGAQFVARGSGRPELLAAVERACALGFDYVTLDFGDGATSACDAAALVIAARELAEERSEVRAACGADVGLAKIFVSEGAASVGVDARRLL